MRFLVPCALAKRANTRHNSSTKTIQKIDLWHCKRHFSTAPAQQSRNGKVQICADFCAVWFCFVFYFQSCFCACHRIDFVAQPLRKSSFFERISPFGSVASSRAIRSVPCLSCLLRHHSFLRSETCCWSILLSANDACAERDICHLHYQ